MLKEDQKVVMNQEGEQIIEHISNSSLRLNSFIDGIISYSLGVNLAVSDKQEIFVDKLFDELLRILDSKNEHQIRYTSEVKSIKTNEVAIKQILLNLLSNAIKYNDKEKVEIEIKILNSSGTYDFIIEDNGTGIDKSQYVKIFETFSTLGVKDRFNNSGSGIGLATVKKLIQKLGGVISLDSDMGERTTFTFSIKK